MVVAGLDRPPKDAQDEAYDVAMPLLDELSVRYDVPLPVAQSMVVGVPSGVIHLYFAHRPPAKEIGSEAEILPRCPHPELPGLLSRPDKRGANYWQRFRRIVVPMILIDLLAVRTVRRYPAKRLMLGAVAGE